MYFVILQNGATLFIKEESVSVRKDGGFEFGNDKSTVIMNPLLITSDPRKVVFAEHKKEINKEKLFEGNK